MTGGARRTRNGVGIGLLQVCAAGVLWGTGGLVVSVLHERDGLGALTVSAWRMALAAAALIAFAAVTGRWRAATGTARAHPALVVAVGAARRPTRRSTSSRSCWSG